MMFAGQCSIARALRARPPALRAWSRWPCVTTTWWISAAGRRTASRRSSISVSVRPESTIRFVSPQRTRVLFPSLPLDKTWIRIRERISEEAGGRVEARGKLGSPVDGGSDDAEDLENCSHSGGHDRGWLHGVRDGLPGTGGRYSRSVGIR